MAVRTTETKVKLVLSTSLSTAQIEAFITDASLWVDEELVGEGLGTSRLELIERYLACALIRLRDLGLKSAKFDDIAEQYQVDPEVTDYLLRAASFDPTNLVRRFFMAPKDTRVTLFRTGKSFMDEAEEV
ncbi:hypothetical protein LCGC14_2573930 [marine sediment metagenome]|uniref:Uncharacterized protein n=1 Tax=marine sediment metagenome TaxID=412755 RepID=A0A0F9AGS8_9ZZZZ